MMETILGNGRKKSVNAILLFSGMFNIESFSNPAVGDKDAEDGSTFWFRVNLFHCKECGKPGGISFAGS